jgi:hypothetical protein
MADLIEFTRGSPADHEFFIEADSWSAGGKLFFAAKPQIDDDTGDLASLINAYWDDTAVTTVVGTGADGLENGVTYKRYACHFAGLATASVPSNGALSQELLGEFQWVPASGIDPLTFPPDDEKLQAVIYFDVKRKLVP